LRVEESGHMEIIMTLNSPLPYGSRRCLRSRQTTLYLWWCCTEQESQNYQPCLHCSATESTGRTPEHGTRVADWHNLLSRPFAHKRNTGADSLRCCWHWLPHAQWSTEAKNIIGNLLKHSLVAVVGPAQDGRTSCGDQFGDKGSGE
jgi:hypothetical protein